MEDNLIKSKPQSRIQELDACRGLAALSVVLYHYTTRFNELFHHSNQVRTYWPLGFLGVNFFFILSGYIIFTTLASTKTPREFAAKRLARIAPVFWCGVVTTWTVLSLSGLPGRSVSFGGALANLTMFQTFAGIPFVDGAYWSLQIEVVFYAVVAMVMFREGISSTAVRKMVLGLVVYVSLLHLGSRFNHFPHFLLQMSPYLDYTPLFSIGILLYYYQSEPQHVRQILPQLVFSIATVGYWVPISFLPVIGFTLLFFLVFAGKLKFLGQPPLVFLGTISYALYVVHQNVGYVVIRWGYSAGWHPYLSIAVALITALGLATLFTFVLEKPIRKAILRIASPSVKA